MRHPERSIRSYFSTLVLLCLLLVICFVVGTMVQIGWRWQRMSQLAEQDVISLTLPTIIATNTQLLIAPTAPPSPTATATSTPTASNTVSPSPSPSAKPSQTPQARPVIVIEYVVQAGDTLSQIAAHFNISQAELLEANPEQDPSLLRVNDVLIIPPSGTSSFHARKMEEYTVQAGDTLFQIARQFGLSMEQLQQANPNMESNMINIGDILLIPVIETPIAEERGPPSNDEAKTYVVQDGDTLLAIAIQFDTSLQELLAANPDLELDNRLGVGDTIIIPND